MNFIDVYHRMGLNPLPTYPAVIGVEGSGVVEAVGEAETAFKVGDRVAYAGAPVGAYAEARLLPSARALRLPPGTTELAAASSLLRGLTAHMLLFRVLEVGSGTTLLVHAGAGGLGQILVRWAKHLGARVLATVGSTGKAALAREAGADEVIVHQETDVVAQVKRMTGGDGADAAVDGLGGSFLARTLSCVRPFGRVASVGQAVGPIPPIDADEIGQRRCLSLSRPSVMGYAGETETYREAAAAVLDPAMQSVLSVSAATHPLDEAARAHRDLESGLTVGSVVLLPSL